jgi:hypothetical protein
MINPSGFVIVPWKIPASLGVTDKLLLVPEDKTVTGVSWKARNSVGGGVASLSGPVQVEPMIYQQETEFDSGLPIFQPGFYSMDLYGNPVVVASRVGGVHVYLPNDEDIDWTFFLHAIDWVSDRSTTERQPW